MLKYYNNMNKEKKINWREKARELALNPQDIKKFIKVLENQFYPHSTALINQLYKYQII